MLENEVEKDFSEKMLNTKVRISSLQIIMKKIEACKL